MSTTYYPSKSVTKWVDEILEIVGARHDRAVTELSLEKQHEIRQLNSDYLGFIVLGPVERKRAEVTRRNLLDGHDAGLYRSGH